MSDECGCNTPGCKGVTKVAIHYTQGQVLLRFVDALTAEEDGSVKHYTGNFIFPAESARSIGLGLVKIAVDNEDDDE